MKSVGFKFKSNWSLLAFSILLTCQFFQHSVWAGGNGLSGGSFAFCNQSLVSFKIDMDKIEGYSDFKKHVKKLALKLPKLSDNLAKIKEFDWYFFPINNGNTQCHFMKNQASDKIVGMENLGIQIDQPIKFNYKAKQIYIRGDLFSRQKDKGMQLFNEAVRNLCSRQDEAPDICVANTRVVLDYQEKYSSGDEIILQLLSRPYALWRDDLIGSTQSYKKVLVEMAKIKVDSINELKVAINNSYKSFISKNSCIEEPKLLISDFSELSFKSWTCLTQKDGSGNTNERVVDNTTELQTLLKEKERLSSEIWNNFVSSIFNSYQSRDQSFEEVQQYYYSQLSPAASLNLKMLNENRRLKGFDIFLSQSETQKLMDAFVSDAMNYK